MVRHPADWVGPDAVRNCAPTLARVVKPRRNRCRNCSGAPGPVRQPASAVSDAGIASEKPICRYLSEAIR